MRYGENVLEANTNSSWSCPSCRGTLPWAYYSLDLRDGMLGQIASVVFLSFGAIRVAQFLQHSHIRITIYLMCKGYNCDTAGAMQEFATAASAVCVRVWLLQAPCSDKQSQQVKSQMKTAYLHKFSDVFDSIASSIYAV